MELRRAENKTKYFFTVGWLDLISSIPVIHELRYARVFRIFRLFRIIKSVKMLVGFIKKDKVGSLYSFILLFIVLSVILTSFFVLWVEQETGNIKTAEDTLWWTLVTITTVGYGDFYPVTNLGKLLSSILIINGLIGFGTGVSFVNQKLDEFKEKGKIEQ